MTIFICKSCSELHPCFFDNHSIDDDCLPARCPVEDYEHAKWKISVHNKEQPCKYCEQALKHEPNSRYCSHCGIFFYERWGLKK